MPLPAGTQATLARIEVAAVTRDPESNEEIQGWSTFAEAWVSIDPRSGGEYDEGGGRYSQTVVNMTGDFLALKGTLPGMRLILGDPEQVWDIKTVLPDLDRRGRTKLQCVGGEGAR